MINSKKKDVRFISRRPILTIPIQSSKGVNSTLPFKKPNKIKAFIPSLKHCRGR